MHAPALLHGENVITHLSNSLVQSCTRAGGVSGQLLQEPNKAMPANTAVTIVITQQDISLSHAATGNN